MEVGDAGPYLDRHRCRRYRFRGCVCWALHKVTAAARQRTLQRPFSVQLPVSATRWRAQALAVHCKYAALVNILAAVYIVLGLYNTFANPSKENDDD